MRKIIQHSGFLLTLLIMLCSEKSSTQIHYGMITKSKHKVAKTKMDAFDYRGAIVIYNDILKDSKYALDTMALRRVSQCETNIGQYTDAEKHLIILTQIPTAKISDFHLLANIQKLQKKYRDALNTYQQILIVKPDDIIARRYVENPEFAEEILRDSVIYSVENAREVNSPQSDFAPGFFLNNKIIFSSSRGLGPGAKRQYSWNLQPYLNIYSADITTDSRLSNPSLLNGDVNSRYHEGTMTYDKTANTMYFTRNNFVRGSIKKARSGRLYLGIYTAQYNADNTWSKTSIFPYNNKEWSTGHPSINLSGSRLYFVSDRPGGFGGTDIWYCEKTNSGWGAPINAGDIINTAGNELFPFAFGDSTLYYSTNGLPGLGGVDVFSANVYDNTHSPKNIGYPINSSYDDMGLVLFPDYIHGFFSSNRPGGLGDDDLYTFVIHPPDSVDVEGVVVDEKTNLPLPDALVTIQNEDGSLLQVKTDQNGHYKIRAPYNEAIEIKAEKGDYESSSTVLKTTPRGLAYTADDIKLRKIAFVATGKVVYDIDGQPAPGAVVRLIDNAGAVIDSSIVALDGTYRLALEENKKFKLEVYKVGYVLLTKEVGTFPGTPKTIINDFRIFKLEKGTVVRLDNIYYDYGKWAIRSDAAKELDKLVQILKDNPTMRIELSSHTDARGSDSYNLNLSEKRAKSAVEYLISQGIDTSRLVAKGYGETKLLNRCKNDVKCSEEEHQFNRRTEFTILDI